MKKRDYVKAFNLYELDQILSWIENKNYKLISTRKLGNVIYVYYEKETVY